MRIARRIKTLFRQYNNTQFIVFLFIAVCLWYINKLSAVYSTQIVVSIDVVGAKPVGIINEDDKEIPVSLRVRATGFNLLKNKLIYSEEKIEIPFGELTIQKSGEEDTYRVNMASLERALSSRLPDEIDVVSINDADILIDIENLQTKSVAVMPDLEFSLDGKYMLIGDVVLDPCSVNVTASDYILKNIKQVKTEKKIISDPIREATGVLNIIQERGLTISDKQIKYKINAEQYSEVKIMKHVEIKVTKTYKKDYEKESFYVMPDSVTVTCNVVKSYFSDFNSRDIDVYVDYDIVTSNVRQRVNVRSNNRWVQIVDVDPVFVNVYKEDE